MTGPWQVRRSQSGWGDGLIDWVDGDHYYISVIFSWQVAEAHQRCLFQKAVGKIVHAGGPAVNMRRDLFESVAQLGDLKDAIALHNPNATMTSKGCVRRCKFCIVYESEGDLVEFNNFPIRPIVCDNNILATSKKHFERVCLSMRGLKGVDFNGGLDARLLTKWHVEQLQAVRMKAYRLAWDHTYLENDFMHAYELLRKCGVGKQKIRVYVLIGYDDSPEDALYRLQTVKDLGSFPFPMRYQPVDTPKRNSYMSPNWTVDELKRYVRYWSNLPYHWAIPFEEFY